MANFEDMKAMHYSNSSGRTLEKRFGDYSANEETVQLPKLKNRYIL
jgi:hypothetical protein